jgi:shikimate dehydrogenase
MKKFGLIGYPLGHSFSKSYFTKKFHELGITDCSYENFSMENIDALKAVLQHESSLAGFNITIPHKENIIQYLAVKSKVVAQIGACNCVKIKDNQLYGFNTDVVGFKASLIEKLASHHTHALILGTGGAAKAVAYVLNEIGINFTYVTRNPSVAINAVAYEAVHADLLAAHTLIINTTPLGMHPGIDKCPPIPYHAVTTSHYLYDLVYNPAITLFLKKGMEQGATVKNGMDMLELQAEESWRIWNDSSV